MSALENDTVSFYLPVSERDRKWNIYLRCAGKACFAPHSPYPHHDHESAYIRDWEEGRILQEFQLLYIAKGQGHFRTRLQDGRELEFPIKAGDSFMLFPGIWHHYKPDPEVGWDEYFIGFAGPQADNILRQGFASPASPVIRTKAHEKIIRLYNEIIDFCASDALMQQQILGSAALYLLSLVLGQQQTATPVSQKELVIMQAKVYIESNWNKRISLDDLAKEHGMSYSLFRRAFKQLVGSSPHQFQLQIQLANALRMLHEGRHTIQDISRLVGFGDPFHFSKIFKKHYGCPPSEWVK